MRTYRCKHRVEAARWLDTAQNREVFATWFEEHDGVFETRGSEVVLPADTVPEGAWILRTGDEFVAVDDKDFRATYEEAA